MDNVNHFFCSLELTWDESGIKDGRHATLKLASNNSKMCIIVFILDRQQLGTFNDE